MSEHYFSARPEVTSAPRVARLALPGVSFDLVTDTGVFSAGHVDPGTLILLRTAPEPAVRGDILDLGCGYGPIALTLAHRRKRARVWAVDVNERALDLTRQNAAAAGRGNVRACTPGEVPDDVRFAAIYSNPPIKVGKAALHEMLLHWLPRLLPGGSAHLVVQKHLGSDSLARWLTEQGFPTTRLASERGYRVLTVAAPDRPSGEAPCTSSAPPS
jgi:16S rRNA (guanine1207-N2)-methyltransferase